MKIFKKKQISNDTRSKMNWNLTGDELLLSGELILPYTEQMLTVLNQELKKYNKRALHINLGQVKQIDSSGVSLIKLLQKHLQQRNIQITLTGANEKIQESISTFALHTGISDQQAPQESLIERIGEQAYRFLVVEVKNFLSLMADTMYWTVTDIFNHRYRRKGEFIHQTVLIGTNAIPIIAIISFLIGLVLALQSAAQLRQFGANIFVADLIVISMTREMGPLLTAIMLAGRNGSAIASEIGTMVVTEEIDAIKTMAINPVRYLVVPKMHAMIFALPLLTLMSIILGSLGGMIIGYFYLDITPLVFYNRIQDALRFHDILTGFVKSLIFAGLIVNTGSFYGFNVTGGSEGIGKITTASVVTSIFLVILADSTLGLIFYFE